MLCLPKTTIWLRGCLVLWLNLDGASSTEGVVIDKETEDRKRQVDALNSDCLLNILLLKEIVSFMPTTSYEALGQVKAQFTKRLATIHGTQTSTPAIVTADMKPCYMNSILYRYSLLILVRGSRYICPRSFHHGLIACSL